MVSIGYGSDKETRFMLPCGFFKHRISTVHELKTLFMNNKTHAAQIAHGVSARSRKQILEEAKRWACVSSTPTPSCARKNCKGLSRLLE